MPKGTRIFNITDYEATIINMVPGGPGLEIDFSNSNSLLEGYVNDINYTTDIFYINKNAVVNNNRTFKVRINVFKNGNVTIYAVNYDETGALIILDSVVKTVTIGINLYGNDLFPSLAGDYFIGVWSAIDGLIRGKVLAGASIKYNAGVASVFGYEMSYNVTINYGYSSDLQTMINNNEIVYLDSRVYPISSQIVVPANRKLIGVPRKTVLLDRGTTDSVMTIYNTNDVLINGLTFVGNIASDYVSTSNGITVHPFDEVNPTDQVDQICTKVGIGTQTGLWIYNSERVEVTNCYFKRFSKYGMQISKTGSSIKWGVKIHDNYFYNNYCGLYSNLEAEYSQISDNTFSTNMIGAFITTGNLLFNNNYFIHGVAGVVLYNSIAVGEPISTDEGYNHAHGTLGNCTFNHNTLFGLVAQNIYNTELINAGQFWYGPIYLKNCRGITITNSLIHPAVYLEGSAFQYDNTKPGNNAFIGCTWGTQNPNENYNSSTSYTILKVNYRYLGGDSSAINN